MRPRCLDLFEVLLFKGISVVQPEAPLVCSLACSYKHWNINRGIRASTSASHISSFLTVIEKRPAKKIVRGFG